LAVDPPLYAGGHQSGQTKERDDDRSGPDCRMAFSADDDFYAFHQGLRTDPRSTGREHASVRKRDVMVRLGKGSATGKQIE
jgi:hypothetical protein